MNIRVLLFGNIFLSLLSVNILGQTSLTKPHLTMTLFAEGFTRPTDITNCGDSRLFIVQQKGIISIVDSLGHVNPVPFLDLTKKVNSRGNEEGLLGLAFSPDYAEDGVFYVDYTNYDGPAGNCVISRFHRSSENPDVADTTEEKILEIYHPYSNHNGGDLAFGHDGYLYYGIGDGGSEGDPGDRAQNLDTLLGKILRIDVSDSGNYTIPPSNPFVNTPDARPEIWAYGLRNPWRWSFDRLTHDLWIGDVGSSSWEEVDFQPANDPGGENYGWKCWEGYVKFSACNPPDVTFPIYAYSHTAGNCAIMGGYVYRGLQFGDLFGWYLLTDYCSGRFVGIHAKGSGGWIIDTLDVSPQPPYDDLSAFGEDEYGELYIAGNTSGKIWKIGTESCKPTAFIISSDTIDTCHSVLLNTPSGDTSDLKYQWMLNGNNIYGATHSSYLASANGVYNINVSKGACSSVSNPVFVNISDCSGINEINNDYSVSLYPNPVTYGFFINIITPNYCSGDFRIFNIFGKSYLNFTKKLTKGENTIYVKSDTLPSGIYFLLVNFDSKQLIKKFLSIR